MASAAKKAFLSGCAAQDKGNPAEAAELFRSALSTWERLGYRGLEYAKAHNSLASISYNSDNYVATVAYCDKALTALNALAENNTGLTIRAACQLSRGSSLATEAIAALEEALLQSERIGAPQLAIESRIRLAKEYYQFGPIGNAGGLNHLQQAELLLAAPSIDAVHYRVRISEARASLLENLGQHAEALDCLQLVLKAEELQFGPSSRAVAQTMTRMVRNFCALHQFDEAASVVATAISMFEACGLTETSDLAQALYYLGTVFVAHNQLVQALDSFQRSVTLQRKHMASHPFEVARNLTSIAFVLKSLGRSADASDSKSAADAIIRRSQTICAGPDCKLRLRPDGTPLDVCVNCRCTFYCGKACQTADWKAGHKKECKALIAAASEAEAAGKAV